MQNMGNKGVIRKLFKHMELRAILQVGNLLVDDKNGLGQPSSLLKSANFTGLWSATRGEKQQSSRGREYALVARVAALRKAVKLRKYMYLRNWSTVVSYRNPV